MRSGKQFNFNKAKKPQLQKSRKLIFSPWNILVGITVMLYSTAMKIVSVSRSYGLLPVYTVLERVFKI